jgi:hypothetical protein
LKLRPIHSGETDAAVTLLAEGFADRSPEAWRAGLERVLAYASHIGEPSVGQIVSARGADAGICLTIPSTRVAYTGTPQKVVNLGAFYLRPGHEWMAALLMRRLAADAAIDYTDLTASPSMREINRNVGFEDRSHGALVIPLPAAAFRPGRSARILRVHDIPAGRMDDAHRRLLEEHAALGCVAVGVEFDGICHPLIFARLRRRGLPGAQIVLARDRQFIRAALGPIARHLVSRGLTFLMLPGDDRQGFPEAVVWAQSAPVQTTRQPEGDALDFTFSEAVFFQPG